MTIAHRSVLVFAFIIGAGAVASAQTIRVTSHAAGLKRLGHHRRGTRGVRLLHTRCIDLLALRREHTNVHVLHGLLHIQDKFPDAESVASQHGCPETGANQTRHRRKITASRDQALHAILIIHQSGRRLNFRRRSGSRSVRTRSAPATAGCSERATKSRDEQCSDGSFLRVCQQARPQRQACPMK